MKYLRKYYLLLFSLIWTIAVCQQHRCDVPLGIENGNIPDSAITSSIQGSSSSSIRLNQDSAWCFSLPDIPSGQEVSITIDLGRRVFVSAIQNQGPPPSMEEETYTNLLGFNVFNASVMPETGEEPVWGTCCGREQKTFFAEDKFEGVNEINTNPFRELLLARLLKIQFETSIKAGNDKKCLRLEVLGCPADFIPETNLKIKAVTSGLIEVEWQQPMVVLPTPSESFNFSPVIPAYELQIDRWGTSLPNNSKVELFLNTTVSSMAKHYITNPIWGANYRVKLLCLYQGVKVNCGAGEVKAVKEDCTECTPGNELIFRKPESLQGAVMQSGPSSTIIGALVLWWQNTGSGWVSPATTLKVRHIEDGEVKTQSFNSLESIITIEGLVEGESYFVDFIPETDLANPPMFTYPLYLIKWSSVMDVPEDSGFGACLVDLSLEANIIWNGTLRVTWSQAIVRGITEMPTEQPTDPSSTTVGQTSSTTITTSTTETTATTTTSQPSTASSSASGSSDSSSGSTGSTSSSSQSSSSSSSDSTSSSSQSSSSSSTASTSSPSATSTASPTMAASAGPITVARATSYNITLVLNGEILDNKLVSGDSLTADFTSLQLEQEYQVRMTCFLGDLQVDCSDIKAYTALPLSWNNRNGELIIYAGQEVGRSWSDQSSKCRRSASRMISLPSREKDQLFRAGMEMSSEAALYEEIWLGLNMCEDNQGTLWADGSGWQYSRFPRENQGLSSSSCCIKDTTSTTAEGEKTFNWLGMECEAPLPTVCEHKPQGLLGKVTDLARGSATQASASVTWSYQEMFWQPSHILFRYCPTRDLAARSRISNASCSEVKMSPTENLTVSSDLSSFVEYNVTAGAVLKELNFNGEQADTIVRTFPETPVIVTVLPNGYVDFIWAEKVSEFKEDEIIEVDLKGGTSDVPDTKVATRSFSTTAMGMSLSPLKMGKSYHLVVSEVDSGAGTPVNSQTVNFDAVPKCPCTDCQLDVHCYRPSTNKVSGSQAREACTALQYTLTVSQYNSTLLHLIKVAQTVGDDLWVNVVSALGKGLADIGSDSAPEKIVSGATIEPTVPTSATPPVNQAQVVDNTNNCRLVSRSRREIIDASCSELHFSACRFFLPIDPVFPPPEEIQKRSGESWIEINWNTSFSGWSPLKYSVEFQRTRDKRFKRQILNRQFLSPPFVLEGLQDDMEYTLQLVSTLEGGIVSTSSEFEATTGRLGERGTYERLGIASVGWSTSGDIYLLQLFAGSLLIACCIATMLLFFSTGMFYQDCMAQLGFIASLIVSYFLLMLAHPSYVEDSNETGCVILSIVLHASFLSSFLFLTLECHAIAFLFVSQVSNPFQKTNWLVVLLGILLPCLYCMVTGGIINNGYIDPDEHNCWLNATGPAVYAEVIPKFLLALIALLLLLVTCLTKGELPDVIEFEDLKGRQSDCRKLRWVIGVEMVLLCVAWSSGVGAYHTKDTAAHVIFAVATLLLAIVILLCRTYFDETLRSKWHRLCCGTELTYKRSDLVGLSARNRVSPHHGGNPRQAFLSVEPVRPHNSPKSTRRSQIPVARSYLSRSRTASGRPHPFTIDYQPPNTPPSPSGGAKGSNPQDSDDRAVLVRRSYNFNE